MLNDSGILLEYPVVVTGGDGATYWQGCGFPGNIVRATNVTTAIGVGIACVYDALLVQAWGAQVSPALTGYATTSDPIQQVLKTTRCTAATNKLWAGVSLTPAAVNAPIILAGIGSIVPVRSLAAGSLTNNVAGAFVIGSATAGQVDVISAAVTTPVSALGRCVRIAGTTGGQTDSGATDQVVVHIGSGYTS